MTVAEQLGLNLKKVRRRADMSQDDLSRRSGLHHTEISLLRRKRPMLGIAPPASSSRLRAEVSRGELGSRAAVSTRRLAQVEEGKAGATLDVWVRIAGTLDESLDDLLAGVRWVPYQAESHLGAGSYVVRRKSG
jgi:transcriptional regulator with XRE-family HTH domain